MCTHTKRIKSPEKRYRPLSSRGYFDVPCGQCDECRSHSQQEWFVRLWQEMQTYDRVGGTCITFVLTFNDACLPHFDYTDYDTGEVFHIPCFNKHDKDQFVNSIIQFFKRKGLTKKTSSTGLGLKFMFCSEFGETEDRTHRPHYHPVLLLPPDYVKALGFHCETQWMEFLQHYWPYGFVRKSKDYGIFVSSGTDFAARYVSKYCTKDIDWFDQPQVNNFLYDQFGKRIEERYKAIKDYLPRHWQSQGLGKDLVEMCHDDKVFKDGLNFDFLSDRNLGKTRKYPVPRYIRRKLLYDYDKKTGKFSLNDRGKSYNRDYVQLLIDDATLRLSKYVSVDYIKSLKVSSDFYQLYKDRFLDNDLYMTEEALVKSFNDYLPEGVSLQDVCWYNKYIKGRVCHLQDFHLLHNIQPYLDPRKGRLPDVCRYINEISLLDKFEKDEEFSEGFMREKKFSPEMLFFLDDLLVFKKIDVFLQRIEFLKDYLSTRRAKIYRSEVKRRKMVKRMCS